MEYRQFHCQVNGCGRSFTRKEHLTRHEKTHNSINLQTCHVCHRKFNRSDSLLRHLAKHGNVFKPTPSGRSKRACVTCHAGKTKCDGNERCATCVKKGIECRYRKQDGGVQASISPIEPIEPVDQVTWQGSASSRSSAEEQEPSLSSSNQAAPSASNTHSQPQSLTSVSQFRAPNVRGLVDWSAVKIRTDSNSQNASRTQAVDLDVSLDAVSEKYLELYYGRFHHRWPIIHRPSLEEETPVSILLSSMAMIGAWLEGTQQAKTRALDSHEQLVSETLSQLSKITSVDKFQQSLSACLCQAALLAIIFGFYAGRETVLSRALVLRNVLVAVLRDVGFFDPDAVWVDEKPGFFLPFRQVKVNQRMRLAAYLFKIDSYFSLVRNQPTVIMPEELHYGLQSAYSVWNADGLPIWEIRQANEPISRSDKSLHSMINETASESTFSREYPILIEDIQVYMCAIQPRIWKISDHGEHSSDCEISIVLQKDSLRRRLESLKDRLDRIANQNSNDAEFGHEQCLPYRHYFGYEDQSQLGWQDIVTERVNDLLFDTLMLYNLLSLHLYAEVGIFNKLAKYQFLDPLRESSQRHRQAREQRQTHIIKWVGTPTARQALCHAVSILHGHQKIKPTWRQTAAIDTHTLDPITYAALSVGALVVWAYSTFNKLGCDTCLHGSRLNTYHVVELTNWMTSTPQLEKEKETWIEMGAAIPVQLHGIELCKCNADLLTNLFRIYLPPDWELANVTAPGLFDRKESSHA